MKKTVSNKNNLTPIDKLTLLTNDQYDLLKKGGIHCVEWFALFGNGKLKPVLMRILELDEKEFLEVLEEAEKLISPGALKFVFNMNAQVNKEKMI